MKWIGVGSVILATLTMAGCFTSDANQEAPAYKVLQRKVLHNGYGVELSIVGDVQRSDLERLVAKERRVVVRVAVYSPGQTIATDKPVAMWEHTESGGLKRLND